MSMDWKAGLPSVRKPVPVTLRDEGPVKVCPVAQRWIGAFWQGHRAEVAYLGLTITLCRAPRSS
jgi:hypothetical protein